MRVMEKTPFACVSIGVTTLTQKPSACGRVNAVGRRVNDAAVDAGGEAGDGEDAVGPADPDGHRRRVHAAEREADRHRPGA